LYGDDAQSRLAGVCHGIGTLFGIHQCLAGFARNGLLGSVCKSQFYRAAGDVIDDPAPRSALGDSSPGLRTLSTTTTLSFSKTVLVVPDMGCAAAGKDAINASETNTSAPRETCLKAIMAHYRPV
jgi:hypothetical protein